MSSDPNSEVMALRLLRSGPMRTRDLEEAGVPRIVLSRMAASGKIVRMGRGVYRSADGAYDPREVWAAIAKRVPEAVICLHSAASFHGMTQDSAWRLCLAIPHESGLSPRIPEITTEVVRWRSRLSFDLGVETHRIGGIDVRLTSPSRTLVDLFRTSTLNPSCRESAERTTPETFLDALFRYFDPDRSLENMSELTRLAETFRVLDYVMPYVQTAHFAASAGYEHRERVAP